MNTNGNHTEFEQLAVTYLSGNATPEEVDRLEVWVKNDEEKRRLFSELKKSWMLASTSRDIYHTSQAWEKIAGQTFQTPTEDNVRKLHPQPSGILQKVWRIAAVFLLLIVGAYFAYYFIGQRTATWVAADQPQERTLRDGTVITLHRNSTLTYPGRFSGKERRVKLEGEAFFEVSANAGSPFVVETPDVEVHVLGTSFYVNSRSEAEQTEVIVQSGKVAMIASTMEQLPLAEGQRGIYSREQGKLAEVKIENQNFMAWKTRIINFDNTSLRDVFKVVGDTYGVSFSLADPELENCRLTAGFQDQPLADVLAIIAETFGLRYSRSQQLIIVSGEGC